MSLFNGMPCLLVLGDKVGKGGDLPNFLLSLVMSNLDIIPSVYFDDQNILPWLLLLVDNRKA